LGTFRKVDVNIPLLDAIKQIPKYAKFLKELCKHKMKMKGHEWITIDRNVSALIGKFVPHILQKCIHPDTFSITCVIENNKFENAMLDLVLQLMLCLSLFINLCLFDLCNIRV